MKNRELIGSIFWSGVGMIFCIGAIRLSGIPSPGLFPFIAGIILICLSIVVLVSAIKIQGEGKVRRETFFPEKDSIRKYFYIEA